MYKIVHVTQHVWFSVLLSIRWDNNVSQRIVMVVHTCSLSYLGDWGNYGKGKWDIPWQGFCMSHGKYLTCISY
jgi:hypothetical protein